MDSPAIKPLGPTYAKNGFTFELIVRRGPFAIYQQRLRPGVGCLAYEVIRVKEKQDVTMFNRLVEAHESAPSNEDWGRWGWTFPTLALAEAKMKWLEEQEARESKRKK